METYNVGEILLPYEIADDLGPDSDYREQLRKCIGYFHRVIRTETITYPNDYIHLTSMEPEHTCTTGKEGISTWLLEEVFRAQCNYCGSREFNNELLNKKDRVDPKELAICIHCGCECKGLLEAIEKAEIFRAGEGLDAIY